MCPALGKRPLKMEDAAAKRKATDTEGPAMRAWLDWGWGGFRLKCAGLREAG